MRRLVAGVDRDGPVDAPFFQIASALVPVNRLGGLVPARDGRDARARSRDDLSAREHAAEMRRHERAVDRQQTALRQQQVRAPHEVLEVGRLTDGEDDDVALRSVKSSANWGAKRPCASNTDRQLWSRIPVTRPFCSSTWCGPYEHSAITPSSRASSISQGCAGKLVHRLERRQRHVRRTAPQRHASTVHRDVAATDNEHALALDARIALPVARAQELEGARYALRRRSRASARSDSPASPRR